MQSEVKFAFTSLLGLLLLMLIFPVNIGISSTLHVEVAPFGLRSVCIEPGYFQTSLLAEAKLKPSISCIDEYKSILQTNEGALKGGLLVFPSYRRI